MFIQLIAELTSLISIANQTVTLINIVN